MRLSTDRLCLWRCRPPLIVFVQVFEDGGSGWGFGGWVVRRWWPMCVRGGRGGCGVTGGGGAVVAGVGGDGGEVPAMGLAAGERPAADVEVLCSAVASVEYELARRMAAAARSGSLPLVGDGAMLLARGWSAGWARRLARAGAFVEVHPALGGVWASGVITSEHVHALARHADRLTARADGGGDRGAGPVVGAAVPGGGGAVRGPGDPGPDTRHRTRNPTRPPPMRARSLSFALTSDSVILAGVLPRLEGEAVIAAIDAFAERLRSEADHVPASARRADGLVALVNAAHATGSIPTRGGLPVSVSVTLDSTALGRPGVDHLPRAHPDRRRAPVHRLRRAGHPDRDRHGHCPDTVAELLAAAGPRPAGHGSLERQPATGCRPIRSAAP